MSFEGYDVIICRKGHIHKTTYADNIMSWRCPICNEPIQEINDELAIGTVDQTNGLPYELNFKLIELSSEKYQTCICCQHKKLIAHATYKFKFCERYISENGNYIFKS